MNGVIEALHIFDEHNHAILSHTWAGRPLSAAHLLPLFLEHPAPQPNLIYLPNTNPPTLVYSLSHGNLLLLATSSSEVEPLLVLEFLHRIVDAFEEFLGTPLLSSKIEQNYDVVAQLLTEMCDAGAVNTTEPNALRDLVEVEGWVDKLLGSINLPGKPGFAANPTPVSLAALNSPALPWRRANVRHTSNEMYADIVETLTVTLAPSGRPLAAFANGTIAFTSKVSGVPDVTLTLTSSSGKHNLGSIVELPVFHPCVRLARWKERPGELSFIPPDGRFILAGYEVNLLPFTDGLPSGQLKLPVSLEMRTGLGPTGADFDVRIQDLVVRIPLPAEVRNLPEIRPSRGDAVFNPADGVLEWVIPSKDLSAGASSFSLRCTAVGLSAAADQEDDAGGAAIPGSLTDYGYEAPYQASGTTPKKGKGKKGKGRASPASGSSGGGGNGSNGYEEDAKKTAQNKLLMPSSAQVSFSVKGWLASGLKVESIMLDPRKSRGLGEGVKPYKGVKYVTISKGGVELRC
ncbi:related to APM1 - AP-1 complex subunit, mu1 subunit, 54 KD [Cephalotrichum gorgonifer]|uniref:Related to APM1 - AP-1 complex subunit, mu1 subunit, 54 KD n=1 Tax=Cephalotrichum gorgonifer TaxID=2041049 RepID=A0AAE8MSC4_9PEZI|nr:related to APM1 - AP-1 complex subunit, mu1 subunit, 54 KD [Cephalotrichum gorgonifer]